MIVRYGCGSCVELVPDGLWKIAAPLIPPFRPRQQGGGTAPVADRKVFTAVVYVLTSGCAWRYLPPTFGASPATAHRRFTTWTKAGLWRRLHRAVLDELGARGELYWTSAIIELLQGGPRSGDPDRTQRARPPGC
ncbi:transposase [Streptomyces althioticus]|uniref:transposase n=1 Tax=Streptomyces sp. MAD19A TaxID=3242896 RepID=UPI003526CDC1